MGSLTGLITAVGRVGIYIEQSVCNVNQSCAKYNDEPMDQGLA